MAVGTLLSRVTGFGRLAAMAYALGFTRLTDSYNLANTTPNIIYDLVLGGILASFIVPVFVDQLTSNDEEEAWDAISAIVTAAVALLVVTSVVLAAIAPAVIRLYSLRLHGSAARDQQAVATALLRMFAPQLLFYGVTALIAAVLNARRRFFLPMAVPVLNNLIVIALFLSLPHLSHSLTLGGVRHRTGLQLLLGLGTTAGVLVQAVALLPALRRTARRLRFRWDPRHPALRRVVRLSAWTFGYVITNQVSLWIALVLANGTAGGISAYSAAYMFFQLPYGILAVSILTALTPDLAERWSLGDREGFRQRISLGLRTVALVMLPAAVGYLVLARPVVTLLIQHGALRAAQAATTADVLALFAVGLPAFSAYLLFIRGYTSMQDTRTPFLINVMENALTVALDLILYPLMGVTGLALGFTLAYVVGAGVAGWDLRRRAGGLDGAAVGRSVSRIATATAVMAAAVVVVDRIVPGDHGVALLGRVGLVVAVGVGVYLAAARAAGVRELSVVLQLRRRPA